MISRKRPTLSRLEEAKERIEAWRLDYNESRPHQAPQENREAGVRQVHDAKTALIGCGDFFFNSQAAVLKRL
jgi:hypothetical protein